MKLSVEPLENIRGDIRVPGDKSISHRALLCSAMAEGESEIEGFLPGQDCLATVRCLQAMGVNIEFMAEDRLRVDGVGLRGFKEPEDILDAENSGTTARLILGLLAGQRFFSTLTGDASLRKRPMGRVTGPLQQMGARIFGRKGATLLPLSIMGGELNPISYQMPVASAQVKSAILLASLYTTGKTCLWEPVPTRDHTERMFNYFGVNLMKEEHKIIIEGPVCWEGKKIRVPGDISSAAFFIVAASLKPFSELIIRDCGINPTRTGIVEALQEMGADIRFINRRTYNEEPVADILVRGKAEPLRGINIGGEIIPRLIDEIPILVVAASLARGETVIRDAAELRVKETDRIRAITVEFRRLGADIEELPDGLIIRGSSGLQGATCNSHGDHRMAMALTVAGLLADGQVTVNNAECIKVSFPEFTQIIESLKN